MRRFLVVGCGGSGGRTVRLLIDQLRADFRARGWGNLPAAWQFVHIDVPVEPDAGPDPLGTVRDLGGHYLSFSSASNTYQATSLNVESQLRQRGGSYAPLLGWAPRDRSRANGIPVTDGAGQYRAVGRMLTLPRLGQLREVLVDAQARTVAPGAWGGVPADLQGLDSEVVVPIVIASMAGGSGASMFLDVCRILGQLPGVKPQNIGCFLYTADVFAELPPDARANVEGNAMGALAEIISAISRLSEPGDLDTLVGLGLGRPHEGEPPFARVLPIGRRIGGAGAFFGDGTADGVYRGVARALAGVMGSEAASSQYVAYFLGNPLPLTTSSDRFGWRIPDADLPFGSLGFASLSLGRDRYLDYAAQRISRAGVDHLVEGHLNPTSQLPGTDQLRILLDNQWGVSVQAVGLPLAGQTVPEWFGTVAYPRPQWEAAAREALAPVTAIIGNVGQAPAAAWLSAVQAGIGTVRQHVAGTLEQAAYAWAEAWAGLLEAAARAEFVRAVAAFGLPYGRELMARLRLYADVIIGQMHTAGLGTDAIDPVGVDPALVGQAQALGRHSVGADHPLGQELGRSLTESAERRLRHSAARYGAEVLRELSADVLAALQRTADDTLRYLETERARGGSGAGLAQLHSVRYNDWPDESDRVPRRFTHAENEVLLTTADDFPQQYRADVTAMGLGSSGAGGLGSSGVGGPVAPAAPGVSYGEALARLRTEVLQGQWRTAGSTRTEEVLTQRSHWRPSVLPRSAVDGMPTPEARPAYSLRLSPADLNRRAHDRLAAPGDAFARFAGQSIGEYLDDPAVAAVDRMARQERFVALFVDALAKARPVVGLDDRMVQRLHPGRTIAYLYSFSEIPLDPRHPVVGEIERRLRGMTEVRQESTLQNFARSLAGGSSTAGRISVLGSYEKVSPLCYSSLLEPIKQRWDSSSTKEQRNLWQWKRTRPLCSALSMSDDEAISLIAGWYLGRLVGLVRDGRPPEVCTPAGWLSFGQLLESEEASARSSWDVLPAVLMSHVWAVVRCSGDPDLRSLAPYEALRHLVDTSETNQAVPAPDQTTGARLLQQAFADEPLSLGGRALTGDPLSPVLAGAEPEPPGTAAWSDPLAPTPTPIPAGAPPMAVARHRATRAWIDALRERALSSGYLRDGRPWVGTVEALQQAPLEAELLPLVVPALDHLAALADAGLALSALRGNPLEGGRGDDVWH